MRALLFASRRRLWVSLLSMTALVVLGAVALYPDIALRWVDYNFRMVGRVSGQVLPFLFVNCGVAILIFLLEMLVVGYRKSSVYRLFHPDKSMLSDISIFFVNILQIDYIVIFLLTFGMLHKVKLGTRMAMELDQGLLATSGLAPWVQLIIYVLVSDLLLYGAHLLHHKVSFLWPFHSYHHSATEMNVFTANRGHPIQAEFTNTLLMVVPLTLMGFPLISMLIFRILRNIVTFMEHSRLPWSWGWFGRYILVSPYYHRIHHSNNPEHYDKNLAVLFPVWDHLFGTYYRGNVPAVETGLPDNPFNRKSFLHDMTVPFRMLFESKEKSAETSTPVSEPEYTAQT